MYLFMYRLEWGRLVSTLWYSKERVCWSKGSMSNVREVVYLRTLLILKFLRIISDGQHFVLITAKVRRANGRRLLYESCRIQISNVTKFPFNWINSWKQLYLLFFQLYSNQFHHKVPLANKNILEMSNAFADISFLLRWLLIFRYHARPTYMYKLT